jgi:hypothetical protein
MSPNAYYVAEKVSSSERSSRPHGGSMLSRDSVEAMWRIETARRGGVYPRAKTSTLTSANAYEDAFHPNTIFTVQSPGQSVSPSKALGRRNLCWFKYWNVGAMSTRPVWLPFREGKWRRHGALP